MSGFLRARGIRIVDYPQSAQPLRERIRENAEALARDHGLEIEFIRKRNFRQGDRIRDLLKARGDHPGLVHIFSVMEPCTSYKPWHSQRTHQTYLKPDSGKCLHYYFYFIDPELGRCHVRVPTWCPLRLQFYFNAHHWLASQLDQQGIGYELVDNAFTHIDDGDRAQAVAERPDVRRLHRIFDDYAERCCPALEDVDQRYHWSLHQVEYASDIVFHRAEDLQPLYETITRTAIHAVKAEDVATFLGRKLNGNYQGEIGSNYQVRLEGTRIRHQMGSEAGLKLYDKFAHILRVETTLNDVRFFMHYRKVEHRDGTHTFKPAPVKKTIYSLPAVIDLCRAANHRYLAFISQMDDPSAGLKNLHKVAGPARHKDRTVSGFNLLRLEDLRLLWTILRGEFKLSGLRNRDLREALGGRTSSQISRLLLRMRKHGLIKKIGGTHKYYVTRFGERVLLAAMQLREFVLIPSLA